MKINDEDNIKHKNKEQRTKNKRKKDNSIIA